MLYIYVSLNIVGFSVQVVNDAIIVEPSKGGDLYLPRACLNVTFMLQFLHEMDDCVF
jgi:hypothetical protein